MPGGELVYCPRINWTVPLPALELGRVENAAYLSENTWWQKSEKTTKIGGIVFMKLRTPEALGDRPRKTMACPAEQQSRNQKRRPERPPQAEGLPHEESAQSQ